eukprot:TRINITY_DN341_c0_g1_i2.p2 TRINITY_DN341_c0_g1~~TRINITY_DN341_c0_g1_i2.p2  ORF type:complete len:242 (-),score=44.59 TRINITY_DN341_c0_g1_i2:522-1247(-)
MVVAPAQLDFTGVSTVVQKTFARKLKTQKSVLPFVLRRDSNKVLLVLYQSHLFITDRKNDKHLGGRKNLKGTRIGLADVVIYAHPPYFDDAERSLILQRPNAPNGKMIILYFDSDFAKDAWESVLLLNGKSFSKPIEEYKPVPADLVKHILKESPPSQGRWEKLSSSNFRQIVSKSSEMYALFTSLLVHHLDGTRLLETESAIDRVIALKPLSLISAFKHQLSKMREGLPSLFSSPQPSPC